MKKIYLFIVFVLTALTISAAPGQKILRQYVGKSEAAKNQKAIRQLPSSNATKTLSPLTPKRVAGAKHAQSISNAILERPEGLHKYCSENGIGFTLDGDYIYLFQGETAGQMVWADDNVVYLKNAISSLKDVGWVKGTVSDDGKKITVKYPQHVLDLEGEDVTGKIVVVPLYISVMKYDAENNDYLPVTDEENVVTYTVGDDGKIVMDGSKDFDYAYDPETEMETLVMPETMLSCYYEYEPDADGVLRQYWYGFGDISQSFKPLPDDLIVNEYPTGLNFDLWVITDATGVAKSIDVAIAGNEVFMKNIDEYTADCIVKGTIEGDKVIFPSKQFFGTHELYGDFMFFMGCTYGMIWYEEFQDYYEGYALADQLVMDYDAEAKRLTAPEATGFVMNASVDRLLYYSAYLEPIIYGQDPATLNGAPSDPEFMIYERCDEWWQDSFAWIFPSTNVNGAFIDTNKMYYNVFVDDELYTFSPEMYYVSEEMTDIPFKYTDDWAYDIIANGDEHFIYIYGDGMKKFGIKMYYSAPDGKLYSSHRITYNILEDTIESDETGIAALDAEPERMEFVNLQGMKVTQPTAGNVYLRTVTFKDGHREVSKFIAK